MSGTTTAAKTGETFQKRKIEVVFTKALGGKFTTSDANTVTLKDRRVQVSVAQNGGTYAMGTLDLRVYGMTDTLMNDLTFIKGQNITQSGAVGVNADNVIISAGTAQDGMSVVYAGQIMTAVPDYQSAPNVAFSVQSNASMGIALQKVPPQSYPGGADVAVIMGNIARLANLQFENNGVSGIILHNPYLAGTLKDMADNVAMQAGIEWSLVNNVLAIWPRGGARGGLIPLVSAASGLVGYPSRVPGQGVRFVTIFNPAIRPQAKIELRSAVPSCNGIWRVTLMSWQLESETPGGAWYSDIIAYPLSVTI